MKIGAVVCEYNPFHAGHKHQLDVARESLGLDAVVGIMSGNYVQRGEPALFPKRLRAAAALKNGMDLVLELPAVLTLQSAERYARNAVMTLNALGCVDTLFFGAECPETEVLMRIAQALADEDAEFRRQLQAELSKGVSFAAARANTVKVLLGPASAELLCQPNNILAVEYCKALLRCKSSIQPYAIPRKGADHHDREAAEGIASGTAIREIFAAGEDPTPYLPENLREDYAQAPRFSIEKMETAMLAHLCMQTPEQLSQIADVSEGLEYALARSAFSANSLGEAIENVKSKRYAYSRIRRMILNAYLGITKADGDRLPCYIRILDFNETGRQVLNHAKSTATLPLAKNGAQVKNNSTTLALWQRELALDRVYELFYKK